MNDKLWEQVVCFDFDNPPTQYGFSTRLADENFWTRDFTEKAILEYKKFMYLAATADFMVSPSEIVDIVWHQHLIFTQSYQEFCTVLGKQIQHVPSTHNKEDFIKFKQAKERTVLMYEKAFGEQPKSIWGYNNMFESLNLEKAKYKIRSFLVTGILAFICLIIPAYFVLKPIYIHIENPYFVWGLITLTIATVAILEISNRWKLEAIIKGVDKSSFIYHLHPYELVYLETQKLSDVVNGTINELIVDETIRVNTDNTIELIEWKDSNTLHKLQVITTLSETGKTYYPPLLQKLLTKPLFKNTATSMDAFKKYFNKSRKFNHLFCTNFIVLASLLLLSVTRVSTGTMRDKPVGFIIMLSLALTVGAALFLYRLTKQVCNYTIPNLYKDEILNQEQIKNNWQWSYMLYGTTVLSASFIPIANYAGRNFVDGGSGACGSSCGSCGSSCGGGGCGGCGGGD